MSASATPAARGSAAVPPRERLAWLASIVFCGVLPALVLVAMLVATISDGSLAMDFRQFYRAAEAVLAGDDPYPDEDALLTASGRPYVYPPLPALLAMPLTLVSLDVAGILVMGVLVIVALAIPWVLGVTDWRCYGIFLLWPPVLSAIQTGNVTLWLALAAALVWRFRDRTAIAGVSAGATLGVKFLLWPLLVWLLATRRVLAAVVGAAVAVFLLLGSWAAIGFKGMSDYTDLLRRLEEAVGDDAYTLFNLAFDLGAPESLARALWIGVGLALLLGCAVLARRGDERTAFVLALATALALTPLVWLHYFAFLVVAVGVARPRLGIVWFVPLAMFISKGSGDPSPALTAWTLGVAAVTVALAVRESRRLGAAA
jgi:hypothetical protein